MMFARSSGTLRSPVSKRNMLTYRWTYRTRDRLDGRNRHIFKEVLHLAILDLRLSFAFSRDSLTSVPHLLTTAPALFPG
jgi:hypothetical protein